MANRAQASIIHIRHNTRGLRHDNEILAQVMADLGVQTLSCEWELERRLADMPTPDAFHCATAFLYYEHLMRYNPNVACRNQWLIVNPDFFDPMDAEMAHRLRGMLHKSSFSHHTFSARWPSLQHRYLGWTSDDANDPSGDMDYNKVLVLIGQAYRRQLPLIWEILRCTPDFPETTVCIYDPRNVIVLPDLALGRHRVICRFQSQEELRRLMNECGIHLCLGEAESFGHYINEAKSCKALVVAMDGAPMNELVSPEFGFLVRPCRRMPGGHYPVGVGQCRADVVPSEYYFSHEGDRAGFHQAFEELSSLNDTERRRRGALARQSYLTARKAFQQRCASLLGELLAVE